MINDELNLLALVYLLSGMLKFLWPQFTFFRHCLNLWRIKYTELPQVISHPLDFPNFFQQLRLSPSSGIPNSPLYDISTSSLSSMYYPILHVISLSFCLLCYISCIHR